MRYNSTRNKDIKVSSSEAIIQGISKDGGLYVPEYIPKLDNLDRLENMNYRELAYEIMSKFLTDFEEDALKKCIQKAYDDKFSTEDIAPTVKVGDSFILELFHGPTLAFKDMALSILPHLLTESMRIQGIEKEVAILTATSGDTGKAALEGFANVDKIKIIVFYPENGVSKVQKMQMITQEGDNTFVVGINGNFDDAQTGIKEIFNDSEFADELEKKNYRFSSANSINIGRLVPQIVYYFYSYLTLLRKGEINKSERINVAVPTGNFGNILAAYYAKEMGLPINKLICASNDNKVLADFINTSIYDRRRDLILTSSPSMDILVSSNLERFLYHINGDDDKLVETKMEELRKDGYYKIENFNKSNIYGGFADESQVEKTIDKVYKNDDYLMDTHTGVAYSVYEKYKEEMKDDTKVIIASTASPYKFGTRVAEAIGLNVEGKDEFTILEQLEKETDVIIPEPIRELNNKKIVHNNNCNKEDMKKMVKEFLLEGDMND